MKHHGPKRYGRTIGPIDLETVRGIDDAMEIAINCGDRSMFGRLIEIRRAKVAASNPDLAKVDALLREVSQPEPAPGSLLAAIQMASARFRKIASECDRSRIAAVLSNTSGRAARPVPVCSECGERLDSDDSCDWCDW